MQAPVSTRQSNSPDATIAISSSLLAATASERFVSPGEVRIIRREELSSLRHVVVDGKEFLLGDHRDFYRHPYLAKFIPQNARLGIAWVRIKAGEMLETHVHPIESMILICEGEAEFYGEFKRPIYAGDIIAVPRGARHGFRGTGRDGFHGLSIQFEQRGLYEDIDHALVSFLEKDGGVTITASDNEQPTLESLVRRNEQYKHRFHNNLLFRMMSADCFSEPAVKQQFLNYFQTWSNEFQKAMFLKTALCEDPAFIPIFRKHFIEELDHDQALNQDRNGAKTKWDAVLAATSAWFPNKMISANHCEQIVIMHLCVEAVAVVFYKFARPALDPDNKMAHFRAHDGVDEEHERLGVELLKNLSEVQYRRLMAVQDEAWAMSAALFSRLGELAQARE